jgi:hypothetical protein
MGSTKIVNEKNRASGKAGSSSGIATVEMQQNKRLSFLWYHMGKRILLNKLHIQLILITFTLVIASLFNIIKPLTAHATVACPYAITTYGICPATPVCSITQITPSPVRFDGSGTYWLQMTIKNTTSAANEDGIFFGTSSTGNSAGITVVQSYYVDGTGIFHASETNGFQSGSTYAWFAGDFGTTAWTPGTSAQWGIKFTVTTPATIDNQPFFISVHRVGATGGNICQNQVTGNDPMASWEHMRFSDACPSGTSGTYPYCGVASSGGGSTTITGPVTSVVDFTSLKDFIHKEGVDAIALAIACFVAILLIRPFRWRK